MLKAKHSKTANFIFDKYIVNLLKKNFHSISILGKLPEIVSNNPLLLIPNHSTWWDGFFVYLINRELFRRKFYIMIMEEQLSKYKFFLKLGGYSINRTSLKKMFESLEYTSSQMKKYPDSVFTIFPQGELLPYFSYPFKFSNGINKIVDLYDGKINLLVLSMNIFYLNEEKPEVFLRFHPNQVIEKCSFEGIKNYELVLQDLMEQTKKDIINGNKGEIILSGKKSVSEKSQNLFGLRKT